MIVIISNLIDAIATDNIAEVSCHAQSDGYAELDIDNFAIKANETFSEEFINAIEDFQYTDCKITFGKDETDVNSVYLDNVEFTISDQQSVLHIKGGNFRWA